jgi:hypothetical protein
MSRHSGAVLVMAWIAWAHASFPSKGIDSWEPAGAAETADECKQTAVTAAGNTVRKLRTQDERGTIFTQTGAVIDMAFASGEKASMGFVCLPDTVDPRGSKGAR